MSESEGYNRVSTFYFDAGGEEWEVLGYEEAWLEFKETRRSGHEDTHVYAQADLVDERWVINKDESGNLYHYRAAGVAADIEAFLNEHGAPCE